MSLPFPPGVSQRQKSVLIVYSTRYPEVRGGVDTMIISLVDQLRKRHDVCLFAAGEPDEKEMTSTTVDGITTYAMHLRLPYYSRFGIRNFAAWLVEFPRSVLRLRRLVRAQKIDIVHLHMLNRYHLAFAILRLLGGPPYVVTLHRAEVLAHPTHPWITRQISNLILHNAAQINAVSHAMAEIAARTFRKTKAISPIPNGIEIAGLPAISRREIEDAIAMSLPEKHFTTIGVLMTYKGQDVAIRAWKEIVDRCPDVHLFIVGSGGLEERYRNLIESLSLTGRVHLTGALPREIAVSLARNSLGFIAPSRSEGLSYVFLEAGALGLPMVCSDIPPFVEVIRDEESALVVPVEDYAALASAVQRLVDSPELRQNIGDAFRRRVETTYSSDAMARSYEELYLRALQD